MLTSNITLMLSTTYTFVNRGFSRCFLTSARARSDSRVATSFFSTKSGLSFLIYHDNELAPIVEPDRLKDGESYLSINSAERG